MVLPAHLSEFIGNLKTVSDSVWEEGGLVVETVSTVPPNNDISLPLASDEELLEFFACAQGNRSGENKEAAQPLVRKFFGAIAADFQNREVNVHFEEIEGSWSYQLHIQIEEPGAPLYFRLFWSVD